MSNNTAYAVVKFSAAGSGPGGGLLADYFVLAPDNSVVVSNAETAATVNYGDSREAVLESLRSAIRTQQDDTHLEVVFVP